MKRTLLFALSAVAAISMVSAQDAKPLVEESQSSPNLKLEWYSLTGDLDGSKARAGIGTNGKFYVVEHSVGVHIFDKNGEIKKIANPTTWVGINCDDAGHVYFRNDENGFPGPEWAGWYVPGWGHFCIIDAATDDLIKTDVPIVGGGKCRFDALPHIKGDMLNDMFELTAPVNATSQRVYDWLYNLENPGLVDECNFLDINIEPYFQAAEYPSLEDGNTAALINTLGNTQIFSAGDDDYMAVLPNANVYITFANNGWGNCIGEMKYDESRETYSFTGKFFKTPNHSAVGGFHIFEYAGDNYIVYPSGQATPGIPSADGFAVMKLTTVDVPTNEVPIPQSEIDETAAIHFGTEGLASGNNWRGINVEPVEGQDGIFTIYFYSAGAAMEVWTLDLTGGSGVADVLAEETAAPVYYNIQGVRVANPSNGIFIEVRGNKATKVVK